MPRKPVKPASEDRYGRRARSTCLETWRKALPECPPGPVDEAAQRAIAALRGFVIERAIEGPRSTKKPQREIVLRSVLEILGLRGAQRRPSQRRRRHHAREHGLERDSDAEIVSHEAGKYSRKGRR